MRSDKNSEAIAVIELIERCEQLACRQLCESILDDGQIAAGNPFGGAFRRVDAIAKNGIKGVYGDVAEHVINALDLKLKENDITRDEYVSLHEYSRGVGGYISCPPIGKIDKSNIESIALSMINELVGAFSISLMNICNSVYLGAPLYTRNSETGSFQLVDTSNENRSFMCSLGKNAIEFRCTIFPSWMSGYYFKRTEIEAQHSFFNGSDLSDQQIESLRSAYSQFIAEHQEFDSDEDNSLSSIERTDTRFLSQSNTVGKKIVNKLPPETKCIAAAFPKPETIDQDWKKYLSNVRRDAPWLRHAQIENSGRAGVPARWLPHIFAACLVEKKYLSRSQANKIIRDCFKDWIGDWENLPQSCRDGNP